VANNKKIFDGLRDRFPYPYSESDAEWFIDFALTKKTPGTHFVIDVNGEAVGGVEVMLKEDIERKNAEIGYWIGESFWGQGIMTKVVKTIVDYAFKNFDIIRIYATPFSSSVGSMKVLEKADFKTASESRDKKWKHKVAEEIGVEATDEEEEEEAAMVKKKQEIMSKKENIKQNLSTKNVRQYSYGRKNVYLSLEEIKKISEELNQMKREQPVEIRDQSRTLDQPIDKKLKYKVKPARDPSLRRYKRKPITNSFITGPFGIAERNIGKRKPSIKQKSGSKKKFKRK